MVDRPGGGAAAAPVRHASLSGTTPVSGTLAPWNVSLRSTEPLAAEAASRPTTTTTNDRQTTKTPVVQTDLVRTCLRPSLALTACEACPPASTVGNRRVAPRQCCIS